MKKITTSVIAAMLAISMISVSYAEDGGESGPKTGPYPAPITYGKTGMSVLFSHEMHIDMMGYGCADCHDGELFELKTFAARNKGGFTMEAMYEGGYCGKCHDGDTAFDASDFGNCGSCHNGAAATEITKVVGPQEDIMLGSEGSFARFSHQSHQDIFECVECHTAIFPVKNTGTITTMDEINAKKACGTCHNGGFAFDASECGACHPEM